MSDRTMRFNGKSGFFLTTTLLLALSMSTWTTIVWAYGPAGQQISADQNSDSSADYANSEEEKAYIYSQAGYYQEPYIFELGWNINERGFAPYPDKAQVMLSDGSLLSVSFDRSCSEFIQNKDAMSALSTLLDELKAKHAGSALELKKPLVMSVQKVDLNDLENVAEEYYASKRLTYFSAIFSELDDETKAHYFDRMFADSNVSFFASVLHKVDTELIEVYLERAYDENKVSFFSIAAGYLSDSQRQKWIERASHDRRAAFVAVLSN